MHPDLVFTAYRQQRRELDVELLRRWAVQQRTGDARRPTPPAAPMLGGRLSTRTHAVVDAMVGWSARGRQAVREASSPTPCCSPA